MELEQLYLVAEIIGTLAVKVSIIYLGIQIRNTRIQNQKEMHLNMSKFGSELTLNFAPASSKLCLVALK